jgi:hypothetical protein
MPNTSLINQYVQMGRFVSLLCANSMHGGGEFQPVSRRFGSALKLNTYSSLSILCKQFCSPGKALCCIWQIVTPVIKLGKGLYKSKRSSCQCLDPSPSWLPKAMATTMGLFKVPSDSPTDFQLYGYAVICRNPEQEERHCCSLMVVDNPYISLHNQSFFVENYHWFQVAGVPPTHFLQVTGNGSKLVGPSYIPRLRTNWPRAKPLVDT